MTSPHPLPPPAARPWPDPMSLEVRERASFAIDELLGACLGGARRQAVEAALLGELADHSAEILARWGDPDVVRDRLEAIVAALQADYNVLTVRAGAVAAPVLAAEEARDLLERECEAWPPGPQTFAAIAQAHLVAAIARAGRDLGGGDALRVARRALIAFEAAEAMRAAERIQALGFGLRDRFFR